MKTKYLMITVTEACNLSCVYCYEKNKSAKSISVDKAISLIEKELLADDGYELCEITFHGGEPFMAFDAMKEICEYIWARTWKIEYYFFVATNGTKISSEAKAWLSEHRKQFICGLSIDGNRIMQNINRNNSFDLIDLDFFVNNWPKQDVKVTISNHTLPMLADGLIFLHEKGFSIADNFAYGIDWSNPDNASELVKQLNILIEYYITHPDVQPSRLLSVKLEYLLADVNDDRTCGIGSGMKVYDTEGNQYPCHYFEPVSVGQEASDAAKSIDFQNLKLYQDPACKTCPIKTICPTCYGANYAATGNISTRDKNMCALTWVSAYATAMLVYRKIETFGIESIHEDKKIQEAILAGMLKLQQLDP